MLQFQADYYDPPDEVDADYFPVDELDCEFSHIDAVTHNEIEKRTVTIALNKSYNVEDDEEIDLTPYVPAMVLAFFGDSSYAAAKLDDAYAKTVTVQPDDQNREEVWIDLGDGTLLGGDVTYNVVEKTDEDYAYDY